MPRELPTHFSPRCSDTGPNLGYRFDPLLKEKVIAFSFFKICLPPLGVNAINVPKLTKLTPCECFQCSFNWLAKT